MNGDNDSQITEFSKDWGYQVTYSMRRKEIHNAPLVTLSLSLSFSRGGEA